MAAMFGSFAVDKKIENRKCAKTCYSPYFSGINDEEDENFWTRWVEKRMNEMREIAEKVALFIAPSNYLRNRFVADFGVKKEKILYLDYGFPTHNLKKTLLNAEKRHFTFGYIGTHIPAKGVNLLIEAFSKIEKMAILKIFGRQSGQSSISLHQLAQKSQNPIQFMGEYQNENLAEVVFSNIDCIVVPSIWAENSPLVIHEAQACKIPVITANFGGMKEYISHGVNGLLFEHRNTKSLHEQLNFALENPDLMKKLGQKAYLYSENGEVPHILAHCEKLVSLYQSILEKNGIQEC
jgi:glycosyltransferase involved in cell wall biosynthesis